MQKKRFSLIRIILRSGNIAKIKSLHRLHFQLPNNLHTTGNNMCQT